MSISADTTINKSTSGNLTVKTIKSNPVIVNSSQKRLNQFTFNLLLQCSIPVSIFILWILATNFDWIKPYFVPKLSVIFLRFIEMIRFESFLLDFWLSFHIMLIGYAIGAFLGLATGVSAGLSRTVDAIVSPTINAIRQVPFMAWIPLFVLFLGITTPMKLAFLAKVVAVPVFLNTFQGIRSVNKEYLEVAEVFEYNRWRSLYKVVLPAAFPSIFTGLRFSLGASWGAVVVAEMLNGRQGVGWVLNDALELLDSPRLYVSIFVIGFVGLTFDLFLGKVERKLMKWKKQAI